MHKPLMLAFALAVPSTAVFAADQNPDASFFKKAAEGGMAEVELGQLAQEKSALPAVKDFGSMMVSDHTAANDKLRALAAGKNVELPDSPSLMQKATKTKLEVLKGSTFDKSYIKGMVKDHQDDIKEFVKEAAYGKDPDARAFAKSTLPTLRTHLKKIQAIAADQGIAKD
jgi:putative membrane protein